MDPKEINPVVPTLIPGPGPRPVGKPVQIPPTSGPGFRQILESAVVAPGQPLKFSAHAAARLQSRNINLSPEDIAKMNAMADKAAAKGAKQSLFIMRDVALVVSVKNRTVITAVDQDSMRENVFTNIDSAAII